MTSKLERIEAALAEYEAAIQFLKEHQGSARRSGKTTAYKAINELNALAPTALRELLAVAEAAWAIEPYDFLADEFFECNVCKGKPIRNSQSVVVGYHHEDDCRVKALEDALKALDSE